MSLHAEPDTLIIAVSIGIVATILLVTAAIAVLYTCPVFIALCKRKREAIYDEPHYDIVAPPCLPPPHLPPRQLTATVLTAAAGLQEQHDHSVNSIQNANNSLDSNGMGHGHEVFVDIIYEPHDDDIDMPIDHELSAEEQPEQSTCMLNTNANHDRIRPAMATDSRPISDESSSVDACISAEDNNTSTVDISHSSESPPCHDQSLVEPETKMDSGAIDDSNNMSSVDVVRITVNEFYQPNEEATFILKQNPVYGTNPHIAPEIETAENVAYTSAQ